MIELYRAKHLLSFFLIATLCCLVSTQGQAQTTLYQKKEPTKEETAQETTTQQVLRTKDEKLLNDITSVRLLLISGERLQSLAEIKVLLSQLADEKGGKHYKDAPLSLVRLSKGRNGRHLYFLPSYKEILYGGPSTDKDNEELDEQPNETALFLQDQTWEDVTASLDINYGSMGSYLFKAYEAVQKGKLEKADGVLQDLYGDMIRDASLQGDPISNLKEGLKLADRLLSQGNITDAFDILNTSELALLDHLEKNLEAPYAGKLFEIQKGFDTIKSYKWDGKKSEISRARTKAIQTVNDMRAKLKSIKTELPR